MQKKIGNRKDYPKKSLKNNIIYIKIYKIYLKKYSKRLEALNSAGK